MVLVEDIIKLVITSISVIDFMIFTVLFLVYMVIIPFKADKWLTKIGSIVVILCFITFKLLHVPAFLIETKAFIYINIPYKDYILLTLTWANILLALVPLMTTIITFIKSIKNKKDEKTYTDKHINIIMPIYNETPDALCKAIDSVKNLDYEKKNIHLYLAFDDDNEPEAFTFIMKKWKIKDYKDTLIIRVHDEIKITVCRFKHGGKKSAQEGAYFVIRDDYTTSELNESLLLFIDSDIQLKKDALWQFVKYMTKYNKNCLTGLITCITSEKSNFWAYYQDIEYVSGQIFWRNMENFFGATSCLPGALTMMKWTTFDSITEEYFSKKTYNDVFDYHRFYLGEDRYLTHLIMEKEPWKIGFCIDARCKTEAPDTLMSLLKQRRRWFLGHISNDTWMLSSIKLWLKYPMLILFNFLNNSRNTSIYIYLIYFVLFLNKNISIINWLIYVMIPLLLNWLFIVYYSTKIKRRMNIVFYFLIVIIQPVLNMMFMYYTLYTIRKNSWGGARVERNLKQELKEVVVEK